MVPDCAEATAKISSVIPNAAAMRWGRRNVLSSFWDREKPMRAYRKLMVS